MTPEIERTLHLTSIVIVDELNRVLRGWCHYFRWGHSSRQFTQIDVYVRERLALFDSKKRGRHGRRWGQVHTTTWYARLGAFTLLFREAYLAGHDWGYVVLHKFVRSHPEHSKKLLLVNPFLPGAETQALSQAHFHESWYWQFHQVPMAVELVGYSRETIKICFSYMLAHGNPTNPKLYSDEEIEIFVDNFLKHGNVEGGFSVYRASLSAGAWNKLDRTPAGIETLVLWGMADPFVPAEWSVYVSDWYTNFVFKAVHEVGHFLNKEAADVFNREATEFFKS